MDNLQAMGMLQAAAAQSGTRMVTSLHQVQGKRRLLRTPSHLLGVVIGIGKVGVHNQLGAVGLDHCGRALCAEDMR